MNELSTAVGSMLIARDRPLSPRALPEEPLVLIFEHVYDDLLRSPRWCPSPDMVESPKPSSADMFAPFGLAVRLAPSLPLLNGGIWHRSDVLPPYTDVVFNVVVECRIWQDLLRRVLPTIATLSAHFTKEGTSVWRKAGKGRTGLGDTVLRLVRTVPGSLSALRSLTLYLGDTGTFSDVLELLRATPQLDSLFHLTLCGHLEHALLVDYILPVIVEPSQETLQSLSLALPVYDPPDDSLFMDYFRTPFPRLRSLTLRRIPLPVGSSGLLLRLCPAIDTVALVPASSDLPPDFPFPTSSLRFYSLPCARLADLAGFVALLSDLATAPHFATLSTLELDFDALNHDDSVVRAQLAILSARCADLAIRLVTSLVWDVEDGEYDPETVSADPTVCSANDSGDATMDDGTDDLSEGSSSGTDGEDDWDLDWDAEEDEVFRERWSEERRMEHDFDRGFDSLVSLQHLFPDRERYEAAVEAAKRAFKKHMD
ncbi:hypothetical protein JCM8097_003160 [Rhodosporidiobolus ruineniae]